VGAKLFASVLGLAVVFVMALWAGEANAFEEGVHGAAYTGFTWSVCSVREGTTRLSWSRLCSIRAGDTD
jgi:hypothetical protein